tara:strand:+ start:226 stop:396 length:171 start_codon:yes stop_codon:yes gene_type:complete
MTEDDDKYYYPIIKEDPKPAQVPLYLPLPQPPMRDPEEGREEEEKGSKRGVIIIDL